MNCDTCGKLMEDLEYLWASTCLECVPRNLRKSEMGLSFHDIDDEIPTPEQEQLVEESLNQLKKLLGDE